MEQADLAAMWQAELCWLRGMTYQWIHLFVDPLDEVDRPINVVVSAQC